MSSTPNNSLTVMVVLFIADHWRLVAGVLGAIVAAVTSCHIVLNRRDYRAALWWVGVVWVAPFIGALAYYHFGINRIRRRALSIRRSKKRSRSTRTRYSDAAKPPYVSPVFGHLYALSRLVDKVVERPLAKGNRITPYLNGDAAYPAMIEAIDNAKKSVSLACYIFHADRAGMPIIDALSRASKRGVDVRVLIDDLGSSAWGLSVPRALAARGVRHACFLPSFAPWRIAYLNLRNHRKMMVVDGSVGFTGSMNIHEANILGLNTRSPIQDIHFKVEGPVCAHIQDAFRDDWYFCTGEILQGETWYPPIESVGNTMARGIVDGPDESFEHLRLALLAALANARSSVKIVTPYFVPDPAMVTALNLASLSGIQVDIVLPQVSDMALVRWAGTPSVGLVLERGCRVWATPPPFDHSKLMVVDDTWTLFGSSNWDTRSLRLNFEFNVECYDEALARQVAGLIDEKIRGARPVTLEEIRNRPMAIKLRDGFARLFSPHL